MAPSVIVDLATARESLVIPTQLAAWLARHCGLTLVGIRPGRVEALHPQGYTVAIRVTMVNIYRAEAEAYLLSGKPVPTRVLEDIETWDRLHGIRS